MTNCSPSKKKLCGNCEICIQRSFSTIYNSKFILDEDPKVIFKYSKQKYDFNCNKCYHSFEKSVSDITFGQWCPYCSKPPKRLCGNCEICFGRSIASIDRAKSCWETSLNDNLDPKFVFKGARKKRWFGCDTCNHKFEISPNHITTHNQWCPYCSNILLCENDCEDCFEKSFASVELYSKLWFTEMNGGVAPRDVFKNSHKKYWFKCDKCNSKFEKQLDNLNLHDTGCSCLGYWKTEIECRDIFEKLTGFDFPKRSRFLDNKYELDGYCEELSIAFEYQGEPHYYFIEFFHKTIRIFLERHLADKIKQVLCRKNDIKLITIPYFIKDKEEFIINKLEKLL